MLRQLYYRRKVTMQTEFAFFKPSPFAYFNFLKRCKRGDGFALLCEVKCEDGYNSDIIKGLHYYEVHAFKTFICELVYNGVNLFPEICEYTITCENEMGKCELSLGLFEEMTGDEGHPCMAKFTFVCSEGSQIYHLNLADIKNIYCNNRHKDVNQECINVLVIYMYMGGSDPRVSTTSKINVPYFKDIKKIK